MTMSYWDEKDISPAQYVFRMDVKLRDGRHGNAIGPCSLEGSNVWCGVECDGGGVLLKAQGENKILIDLEQAGYIAVTSGCADDLAEEGFALESGRDDRAFLLTAMPQNQCVPANY